MESISKRLWKNLTLDRAAVHRTLNRIPIASIGPIPGHAQSGQPYYPLSFNLFRRRQAMQTEYDNETAAENTPTQDTGRSDPHQAENPVPGETGGLDPTRYGDWEKNGRCIDF